jgi:predicted N-acetyltransferase YhbS
LNPACSVPKPPKRLDFTWDRLSHCGHEATALFHHDPKTIADLTGLEICTATAAHAPGISAVIRDSLWTTNIKDYTQDVIERIAQNFTPIHVQALIEKRDVIVALLGQRVVGTAGLDGNVVRTMFVAPEVQNKGIGRRLVHELEHRARAKGITTLSVPSSITAEPFYAKLGFVAVRDSYHGAERTIVMERRL